MISGRSSLKYYFQRIANLSISERELAEVIQVSRSIIHGYLLHQRSSLTHLCTHQGFTVEDLSFDCVAEAFGRDGDGQFLQMANFLTSLDSDINELPEADLLLAFRVFLVRVADAQLARLYALADPVGARIHRNLRFCLKDSPLFLVTKTSHGLLLCPVDHPSLEHLEKYPVEELETHFRSYSRNLRLIPQLLGVLHEVITIQSTYRRIISLVDVVQLFKRYYQPDDADHDDNPDQLLLDTLHEIEIDQVSRQVESALKEKIFVTYLSKGKISRHEAESMLSAFQDMFIDWKTPEASDPSLFEYVVRYLEIDEQTFEANLRVKMSYLLKFVREEFKTRLFRDL